MVENLEELTLEFGCKVGALLFSYLGLPFKFVVLLDGAEERLLQKFCYVENTVYLQRLETNLDL